MGRRYLLPNGMAIEICALNSSSLETGRQFLAGVGRVNEAAMEDVAVALGWKNTSAESMALRLLMIHHHLALTEDLEPAAGYGRGFGLALDAVRVQRMAAKYGVQLAIHGHKHRSFLWRSSVFELPEHSQTKYFLGDLAIAGGGSAGSIETEGNSNYFNLMNFDSKAVKLSIYRAIKCGQFERIQDWEAPLSMGERKGKLSLGTWTLTKEDGSKS